MGLLLMDLISSSILGSLFIQFCLSCCFSSLFAGFPAVATTSMAGGNETDRLALLAFKANITNDPLGVMSSWNDSFHFCQWPGVTCGRGTRRHKRVTLLNLPSKQLGGTISPNIGNLSFLRVLALDNNAFSGEIPQEVGGLFRLQALGLENNSLTGEIPINISRCSNLRWLGLGGNELFGKIPMEVGSLLELEVLILDDNSLTGGIPPSFGNLSCLHSLYANHNHLGGIIPNTLGLLTGLKNLSLGQNNLSGTIPSSIYNLSALTILSVRENQIYGSLPPDIGFTLPNLQMLILSGNHLSGPIPYSISNATNLLLFNIGGNEFRGKVPAMTRLRNLQRLYIWENQLGHGDDRDLSFLSSLTNCTKLEWLVIMDNNFGCELPKSLGNFSTHLSFMYLDGNRMYGSIPDGIGDLVNLVGLRMGANQFSGNVPTGIGKLQMLQLLHFNENKLSGNIPSSLGNLTQLFELNLGGNNFQGSIPTTLGNCQNLRTLNLSRNRLAGAIPKQIIGLPFLSTLIDLSENFLTGSLPLNGSTWWHLSYIFLDFNLLKGPLPIPSPFTTIFSVSNNKFSGKVSSLICNQSDLEDPKFSNNSLSSMIEVLNLSNNSLSGMIPPCLGNISLLSVLDLRMNSFHGTIPGTFGEGNRLRNLGLNGNLLEGPVPQSLVNCRNLEVLDLGNNKIHDTFPNWLDTLPELRVLVLRSNKFHGPISNSKTIFPFPKLRIIDLSYNEFIGLLPTKYFQNLKAMMNVDEEKFERRYLGDANYHDSLMLTIKGSEIQMVKILTVFTTIDLSNNKFQGEIPKFIGNLISLRGLNFSHNSLTGLVPPSLGNLTLLESLDLSSNKLNGVIPSELVSLTFLEVLNLSHNLLMGPIPQGEQFATFENNSYDGNLGLCGFPLLKKCSDDNAPQLQPLIPKEDNSEFFDGFGWKAVAMGYGCGMVIGLLVGYLMLLIGKPEWFVRIVEREQHKKAKRSKKSAYRRRRGRN